MNRYGNGFYGKKDEADVRIERQTNRIKRNVKTRNKRIVPKYLVVTRQKDNIKRTKKTQHGGDKENLT